MKKRWDLDRRKFSSIQCIPQAIRIIFHMRNEMRNFLLLLSQPALKSRCCLVSLGRARRHLHASSHRVKHLVSKHAVTVSGDTVPVSCSESLG